MAWQFLPPQEREARASAWSFSQPSKTMKLPSFTPVRLITGFAVALATNVAAVPVFNVTNLSGNPTDWANAGTGLGGSINSNVNFDTHPTGSLINNFYAVSDGVTYATESNIGVMSVPRFWPYQKEVT